MKKKETIQPELKVPKWYLLKARASLKKRVIADIISEYEKSVKLTSKTNYKPSDMEIQDYTQELFKLGINKLFQLKKIEEAKPKLSIFDKVSKLNKKKAMLVTVYHKNGSRTHNVCSKHSRVIKIGECKYLSPPNMGNFDNKYNMMSYSYYENNPFPISFKDDYKNMNAEGVTIPDGELLSKTMEFEFAQRLAHSSLKEKINLAMIFSVLAFVCSAATVLLCLQGFKMI